MLFNGSREYEDADYEFKNFSSRQGQRVLKFTLIRHFFFLLNKIN